MNRDKIKINNILFIPVYHVIPVNSLLRICVVKSFYE